MRLPDHEGTMRSPAEIIYRAAQEHQISPKVILTTLQKEQSLINNRTPSFNQLDKAMGYRCPDGGSCHPNALGFGKQVNGATWQFRQYLLNPAQWNFRVGNTYNLAGYTVSPLTQATAGLYNYTPHYSGNKSFWTLWQRYWGLQYPDGSLVKSDSDSSVWLIQYQSKRLISSYAILLSRFNPRSILPISARDLEKYELGSPIKFHNYSLLGAPDGKVYLLVDDELRHIVSEEVFRRVGFQWDEIIDVTEKDLEAYDPGVPITLDSIYPRGALVQDPRTTGVYYVENSVKSPIYSKEIMTANFPGRQIISADAKTIDGFADGSPVLFKDGTLVRANDDSKIYVISEGKRRWIVTEEAFANFGYKWDNVIVTSAQAVLAHELGEVIE